MEPLDRSHSTYTNWRAVAIILALVVVALAAGFAYSMLEQNRLSNSVTKLSDERDNLQRQIDARQNHTEAPTPRTTYTSGKGTVLIVTSPLSSTTASSPLSVAGEVPGNWSHEASFSVLLKDSQGNIVAQTPAMLEDDWQTENMVPFSATLEWTESLTGDATLILEKANPSGLAEHNDSVEIPLRF